MSNAEQLEARLSAALAELKAADQITASDGLSVRVLGRQITTALHAVETALVICQGDAARARSGAR